MKTNNKQLVLVYGSLRKGMSNHCVLGNSKFIDYYKIPQGNYSMYSLGGFPALLPNVHGEEILCEAYAVDNDVYANVERLEGYPSFYYRETIGTHLGKAEVYVLNEARDASRYPHVESGDWVSYYKEHWGLNSY